MSELSLLDLMGPGRAHHPGHDTERAAALSQQATGGRNRLRVLECLRAAGGYGCTDYEVGQRLGMFRHAAGTRREELVQRHGWQIVDSGRRRPTDTGRNAIVWVLEGPPIA